MIKDHLAKLTKLVGGDSRALRDEADQLRDAKKYGEAAEAYEHYLVLRPDDFGIWVQKGNCLKDSGAHAAAKIAYEAAVKLNPNDADVHLQMGHLAKGQGHRDEAIRCYRRSMKLDPDSGLAAAELQGLGVRLKTTGASLLEAPELKDKAVKIIDISDLLIFLADNTRMTGIQRVQAGVVKELFAEGADTAANGVVIAYYDQTDRAIYAVSPARVNELIQLVGATDVSASDVRRYLQSIYASKTKITLRAIDTFLILGAYWIGDEYSSILLQLKNAGTCIGVFIHDVIPITRPQYVHDSTRQAVAEKFGDVMQLADFAITTTEFVAKEVASLVSSELNRTIPVRVVPLSHELPEISEEDEADEEFASTLPREYVLCVCTLEGRKNHLLLLHAWNALNRKHAGRIPHLILVGKWGWRVEEFRSQLEAQRNVDGKIVILGSISDAQLKHLYEHCLFTVFPSFAEGWGLPIGESLAYGKPCIASNATSMPEVGKDFCRYINPYDPLTATAEIERAIVDRADLQAWTNRIKRDFKIRTWAEVASDLLAKSRQAETAARQSPRRAAVTLAPGAMHRLTRSAVYGADVKSANGRAVKFVCASGWRPLEDWGCWSFRRVATIEFGTELPPKTKVRLFMRLTLPPPTSTDTITIQSDAHESNSVFIPTGPPIWTRIETETDDRGGVKVQLERLGHVAHSQPSYELYFGIGAVGYHAVADLTQRIELLEDLLLFDGAR